MRPARRSVAGMKPKQELADLPFADALVRYEGDWTEQEYDTVHVHGVTVDAADAVSARFLECAFTQVTFDQGGFRRARFIDGWFHEVRFVGTDLTETSWQDVTVIGGLLAGPQMPAARLSRAVFQGCKLDSVNLREAELTDVRFDNGLLRETDLSRATLARVSFPGSRLAGVDLSRAALEKVDLRGAELEISGGAECLRGATISTSQLMGLAPGLAEALGITVD
jgi:uncharacterized protein YjbI with pentapeptide repeats